MTDDLKQRLRELSASRKPYSTGAHGQIIGMESYRIVANGFALECIDEAADRIEELERERDALQAEIAELVAALEAVIPEVAGGNAGLIAYNKCKAALAKVRKP